MLPLFDKLAVIQVGGIQTINDSSEAKKFIVTHHIYQPIKMSKVIKMLGFPLSGS